MAHATSRALPTVRVVRRPTSLLTIGSVACTPFLEDLRATWPWSHRGELARVGVDLEAVGGQAQLICRFEGQHQEGTPGSVSSHRSTALVAICPVPRTTW